MHNLCYEVAAGRQRISYFSSRFQNGTGWIDNFCCSHGLLMRWNKMELIKNGNKAKVLAGLSFKVIAFDNRCFPCCWAELIHYEFVSLVALYKWSNACGWGVALVALWGHGSFSSTIADKQQSFSNLMERVSSTSCLFVRVYSTTPPKKKSHLPIADVDHWYFYSVTFRG